jgi:lipopolysaccharide/colanic/teichoic acid biosynthesis glycosyltransferase
MNKSQAGAKRLFDLVASGFALIIMLPFLCIVSLVVASSSHGPIFFKQDRIGRKGRMFKVVKFRTMYVGSEQAGSITTARDPRITSFGKLLRKYKLDELPQLWNVFIGKMSFVGPRPDVTGYADALQGCDRRLLELRPGITGPASIYFRKEAELLEQSKSPKEFNDKVIWPQKIALNLKYLDTWRFWRDIGYILITLVPWLDRIFRLVPKNNEVLRKKNER